MKKLMPILIILLITIFISCNNSMGSDAAVSPDEAEGAYLLTDTSKGVVFVDETGAETVVKSVENGETVVCKEVIDYKLLNEEENLSKSSVKTVGRKRAVILGYRDDGFPGLWIVYSGGIVRPVVNSEDIETSELLEMAEARQPLFKHFGWTYKALDMAVNGNEIIIAGYAENEDGIPLLGIDPGTTIGMYWSVIEDEDGYYHISRAKVVGYKDNDWWKRYRKEIRKPGYRYRWRWLHSLRLFFFGWYDKYLTMTESVEVGENPGEFEIKGTDDEGTASVATVTAWKVLSIEEAPDDPGPTDPAGMVFSSNSDGDYDIYSLDPDTAIVQLTGKDNIDSYIDKQPALSSDGSKIAFVSNRSGNYAIHTMNSDGSSISGPLASLSGDSDGHPSWNNTGTMIVYDNGGKLYIIKSDGTTPDSGLDGLAGINPSWRSSSDKIVYESGSDIYETDSEGSVSNKISPAFSTDGDPCLSPDGTGIVFTHYEDPDAFIYTMNTDGSGLLKITDNTSGLESSPAWSADGNSIAYVIGGVIYSKNSDGTGTAAILIDNGQDPGW